MGFAERNPSIRSSENAMGFPRIRCGVNPSYKRPGRRTAMTTRREFLKRAGAATGFCSCWMLDAARAQQPAAPRLPVMVAGKRVKTIDVHSHCFFQDALNLLGDEA